MGRVSILPIPALKNIIMLMFWSTLFLRASGKNIQNYTYGYYNNLKLSIEDYCRLLWNRWQDYLLDENIHTWILSNITPQRNSCRHWNTFVILKNTIIIIRIKGKSSRYCCISYTFFTIFLSFSCSVSIWW